MLKKNFFFIFLFFCILINFKLVAADCKKPQMPSNAEWQNWLAEIKKEALDIGISKKTIKNELTSVLPQKKIIMRDRCQPESTITLAEYLFYRVDKARIIGGKKMLKKYHK